MADIIVRGRFIAATPKSKSEFYFPAIRISFGLDPLFKPGMGLRPEFLKHDLIGVIDTGAEACVIDTRIVAAMGLKKSRTDEITRSGVKSSADFYDGQLFIPDINYVLSGEFLASDFRASGSDFDALLGMDLLRIFEIKVNRKENHVSLRFVGN